MLFNSIEFIPHILLFLLLIFGAYLTETKEMPDYRADESFVSWQQDYERYENAVRAKIGDSGLMEE